MSLSPNPRCDLGPIHYLFLHFLKISSFARLYLQIFSCKVLGNWVRPGLMQDLLSNKFCTDKKGAS